MNKWSQQVAVPAHDFKDAAEAIASMSGIPESVAKAFTTFRQKGWEIPYRKGRDCYAEDYAYFVFRVEDVEIGMRTTLPAAVPSQVDVIWRN